MRPLTLELEKLLIDAVRLQLAYFESDGGSSAPVDGDVLHAFEKVMNVLLLIRAECEVLIACRTAQKSIMGSG